MECQSASHLPAAGVVKRADETLLLSEVSRIKMEHGYQTHRTGAWAGFMTYLTERYRDWPKEESVWVHKLRPRDTTDIGGQAQRQGYLGLIYADGNAMGRLVQELNAPETAKFFSVLVDGQVRQACHEALEEVLRPEIDAICRAHRERNALARLPADILLLGGDDLLVLLPAERALDFAARASELFEEYTRKQIDDQHDCDIRKFFNDRDRLGTHGMTFSCGVAIAPDSYPFYLLFDLAEELLKSAKKAGSDDGDGQGAWVPSYIDFHSVAGSASSKLGVIRREDYRIDTEYQRTQRPYHRERLHLLRRSVAELHQARVPRSKLHDLFDAAVEPRPALARRRARELFTRLRRAANRNEQQALWSALERLGTLTDFPWSGPEKKRVTALADIIEAMDLFPMESPESEP
jgi:GGDEF domain-containing protein